MTTCSTRARSGPYENSALVLPFDIRRARLAAHQLTALLPAFVPEIVVRLLFASWQYACVSAGVGATRVA